MVEVANANVSNPIFLEINFLFLADFFYEAHLRPNNFLFSHSHLDPSLLSSRFRQDSSQH